MAEVTIPTEKMNYTIDLLITLVTDEIAEETGKDRKEIVTDFLCSKTGKALYDENTKLWCNCLLYTSCAWNRETTQKGENDMSLQLDIIWNEQCLGIRIGEQVCTYLKKHDACLLYTS